MVTVSKAHDHTSTRTKAMASVTAEKSGATTSTTKRLLKAYKFRFYPTPDQERYFAEVFGCVRFVYNWGLRLRTDAYFGEDDMGVQKKQRMGYNQSSALLTKLKKQPETNFLAQVPAVPLQQSLRHLDVAYKNFFAGRAKYPKFKKKHGLNSAEFTKCAFTYSHMPHCDEQEACSCAAIASRRQQRRLDWCRKTASAIKKCRKEHPTVKIDPQAQRILTIVREERNYALTDCALRKQEHIVRLAKMPGHLHIRWSRPVPKDSAPSTVTVSRDSAGRYYVSLLFEEATKEKELTQARVGVDLGLTAFAVTSDGRVFENPKYFAKSEKSLARAQRIMSRKEKGGRNYGKQRRRVACLHAKVVDQRRDFQHKLSTALVEENQIICVETLRVKNMVRNHRLAKHISDASWGEFVRQLEYKATWMGRQLIRIDTFYPSSKMCSSCGHVLDTLALDVREWECPVCESHHHRDENAAKNILYHGLGWVRPREGADRR